MFAFALKTFSVTESQPFFSYYFPVQEKQATFYDIFAFLSEQSISILSCRAVCLREFVASFYSIHCSTYVATSKFSSPHFSRHIFSSITYTPSFIGTDDSFQRTVALLQLVSDYCRLLTDVLREIWLADNVVAAWRGRGKMFMSQR